MDHILEQFTNCPPITVMFFAYIKPRERVRNWLDSGPAGRTRDSAPKEHRMIHIFEGQIKLIIK